MNIEYINTVVNSYIDNQLFYLYSQYGIHKDYHDFKLEIGSKVFNSIADKIINHEDGRKTYHGFELELNTKDENKLQLWMEC